MRPPPDGPVRRRLSVSGVVQGVGFRPFVYLLAAELGLSGTVANDPAGVLIEIEGPTSAVAAFRRRLEREAPPLAHVAGIAERAVPAVGATGFMIRESARHGGGRTLASPDVATCPACLAELADPSNRRYRHPFISCTNCGPRLSILTDLPYDRDTTTMAPFALCAACAAEYRDPLDRRFHAQTIACHACGPVVALRLAGAAPAIGGAAIAEARRMLADGAILAVKGIGGFHLMCDAANETAVGALRRRKRRGAKPFAVMVRDLATAGGLVVLGEREAALVSSPARPVLLAERRDRRGRVAASVAPGAPDLGVLLAYNPLQVLLFGLEGDPSGPPVLVATSGNRSGEPIATGDDEAIERLGAIVDGWLTHDRAIAAPCDDSVVRVVDGEALPLRRSRGYAPLPVPLPFPVAATLATGADLKATCCLASGTQAWVSQHVGDMDDVATIAAFASAEARMERISGVTPEVVAVDAHPRYRSSGWGRHEAGARPVRPVQHHHAHLAALMGEHGVPRGARVIGIVFDGTGYGADGAVWGGEVLVSSYESFERAAHLAYVPLPGGDAAVERPYRMALAHLSAAGIAWDGDLAPVAACPPLETRALARQLETGFGCAPTSSMGRLFDAIASLCGVRQHVEYEAQAAIELEGLARPAWAEVAGAYGFALGPPGGAAGAPVDAGPVLRSAVADLRAGAPASAVAVRFHRGVVALVAELAERAHEATGLRTVGLTGGVFQNAVLAGAAARELAGRGFTVLTHRLVPPNDGGVALGQVLASAAPAASQEGASPCA